MAFERFSSILRNYETIIRPALRIVMAEVGNVECLLDIGCGDCIVTSELVEDIQPDRLVLADIRQVPRMSFGLQHSFLKNDVCRPDFGASLFGTVQGITCITAFHEFDNPYAAACNILALVPPGGFAFIADRSEAGWAAEKDLVRMEDAASKEHYEEDLEKLRRSGLGTNQGIRSFWNIEISPMFPGPTVLAGKDGMYSFLYLNDASRAMRAA
jgi:hypothetical protein